MYSCHATNTAMPAAPSMRGAKVCTDFQDHWTPPQDKPMRKTVMLAKNSIAPTQSTLLSF